MTPTVVCIAGWRGSGEGREDRAGVEVGSAAADDLLFRSITR